MTSDLLHLVRLEFAVFEGSQQRDCLVTLSHGASNFAEILEDFAQAVTGVMQPAHHGPSWELHQVAYFIVLLAFNSTYKYRSPIFRLPLCQCVPYPLRLFAPPSVLERIAGVTRLPFALV